ncbi:GxxExxY protein [Proteinivorax tanatarense]|uniref:GxxExxY protein n=1 Tax=Proteinivorax tanatarense TaxID=1260629 RepID=A0AAU7VHX0_9FIRM
MLLYEKLAKDVLDASIEVHKILGSNLLEANYEKALFHELRLRGFDCKRQEPINVYYKGVEIGIYYADIVVEDKIILELKSATSLCNEHLAQVIHYLSATDYSLGLLINFGAKKLEFKRVLKN